MSLKKGSLKVKKIGTWKKLYERDLRGIVTEMRDLLKCPAVILLTGEVGVGKTTFARTFIEKYERERGESVGINPSPTYTLVNETPHVAHADFYRLEAAGEVIHLELPLYLDNKDFLLVEWGKKFLSQILREIPEYFHYYELQFELLGMGDQGPNARRSLVLYDMGEELRENKA